MPPNASALTVCLEPTAPHLQNTTARMVSIDHNRPRDIPDIHATNQHDIMSRQTTETQRSGKISVYRGVEWHEQQQCWMATYPTTRGEPKQPQQPQLLGWFQSETRAALAWDAAARRHGGAEQEQRLNFPTKHPSRATLDSWNLGSIGTRPHDDHWAAPVTPEASMETIPRKTFRPLAVAAHDTFPNCTPFHPSHTNNNSRPLDGPADHDHHDQPWRTSSNRRVEEDTTTIAAAAVSPKNDTVIRRLHPKFQVGTTFEKQFEEGWFEGVVTACHHGKKFDVYYPESGLRQTLLRQDFDDDDMNVFSSDDETDRSEQPPDKYPLGTRFFKEFPPDGFFLGRVTSFRKRQGYYKVRYHDGDREELTEADLHELDVLSDPPRPELLVLSAVAAKQNHRANSNNTMVVWSGQNEQRAAPIKKRKIKPEFPTVSSGASVQDLISDTSGDDHHRSSSTIPKKQKLTLSEQRDHTGLSDVSDDDDEDGHRSAWDQRHKFKRLKHKC